MQVTYLKERIGPPEMFVGREKDLHFFLDWIAGIPRELSKSTVILARRKMGKTALMERLFNILFHQNGEGLEGHVIPFYYEIREGSMWALPFAKDFLMTFLYQYLAYKTRNLKYLRMKGLNNYERSIQTFQKEGFEDLTYFFEEAEYCEKQKDYAGLWSLAREAPKVVAELTGEYILQMVDEFQFLNGQFTRDPEGKHMIPDFCGGYLSTAESKVAPMLVSGSWVGWLIQDLMKFLPSRFKRYFLQNLPESDAEQMIFRYADRLQTPVTDETAYLMSKITEGSPFYISGLFRSICPDRDLSTPEGLQKVLEFETLDDAAEIKSTWMEYVASALHRVNDRNGKRIVLYLCQNRDQQMTRKEILDDLQLDMTDEELEKKLKALIKADIISQGDNNFRYQGITDHIFDKIFRGVYQEEIDSFSLEEVHEEYKEKFQDSQKKYRKLLGKFNYHKGYYAEYWILNQFRYHLTEKSKYFCSFTKNLPKDFAFSSYSSVWSYRGTRTNARELQVDLLARAEKPEDYSIIGEIKNRSTKKFTLEEGEKFNHHLQHLQKEEARTKRPLNKILGFVFSRNGFTEKAIQFLQDQGFAYSDDERWLGEEN